MKSYLPIIPKSANKEFTFEETLNSKIEFYSLLPKPEFILPIKQQTRQASAECMEVFILLPP